MPVSKLGIILVCALVATAGCSIIGSRRGVRPLPPDWDIADDTRPAVAAPLSEPATPATPLEPGIPVVPFGETHYQEIWISVDNWSQHQGYGPLKRVLLPAQAISPAMTNAFPWHNLRLKGVSVITAFPTFSLATSEGELVIQSGTLQAYWNGVAFYLGFAPKLVQGELLMRELDLENTIEPLMEIPDPSADPKPKTIVIDPGHGGKDTGSTNIANHDVEKTLTLDWANRLKSQLERRGWHVMLTRTNDVDASPAQRINVAENCRADLFISLHFNYSGERADLAGTEVYCLTPVGLPSNRMQHYADDPWETFPNNKYDAESLRCAFRCEQALISNLGALDHGVRRVRFPGVLADQQRPAILIAGGYLSNPHEAELIANADYRERLAEALAKALE